ncbi:MAG: methylmalonyl-CoA mutase family protein [Flavobacteriaceae bacterium]|nr:methylmalonyl-CoA mutase family protein [Flavobacteriaceae bacterium]
MSDLFKEFDSVDDRQWKNLVQAELKGADFAENLVENVAEGFQIKPIYTKKDVKSNQFVVDTNRWKILTHFRPGVDIDYSFADGVILQNNQIDSFQPAENELIITKFEQEFPVAALNKNAWFDWDFLSDFAFYGNFVDDESKLVPTLKELKNSYQNTLSIDISSYQNAGANHAEQLAMMLLEAHEYVILTGSADILKSTLVCTSVGSDFFFEIAKLRAIRILWANLANSLEVDSKITILAKSSMRNKSLMDRHNNIIRTTYEAASAIFGNADWVQVHTYDELFVEKKDSAHDLSFKQQLVLREESYLDFYADPLKSSYYVEFLTEQLAEKAWELFKKFESDGGFTAGLYSGKIQEMIAFSHEKEQEKFDAAQISLIGVNKFPQSADDFVQFQAKARKLNKSQVKIQTLITRRLSEGVEESYVQNQSK